MIFGEGPIIKNIAGDLNKLFLQGTRAGQPINNVEGDAAADQATVQLMADRDPVIRDISTGLGYAAGREVTVSGTGPLLLVNSIGRALTRWSVELSPYQEGSGDPSPQNVRRIYGTDKLNWFIEELYNQSATPKAVITLLQTIFGGTLASDGVISVFKKIKLSDLAESNWDAGSTPDIGVYRASLPLVAESTDSQVPTRAISDQLRTLAYGPISANDYAALAINGPVNRLIVTTGRTIFTVSDFLNRWGNIEVYYPLATPDQFSITAPNIPTIQGDGSAWVTAEDGIVTNFSATYLQSE